MISIVPKTIQRRRGQPVPVHQSSQTAPSHWVRRSSSIANEAFAPKFFPSKPTWMDAFIWILPVQAYKSPRTNRSPRRSNVHTKRALWIAAKQRTAFGLQRVKSWRPANPVQLSFLVFYVLTKRLFRAHVHFNKVMFAMKYFVVYRLLIQGIELQVIASGSPTCMCHFCRIHSLSIGSIAMNTINCFDYGYFAWRKHFCDDYYGFYYSENTSFLCKLPNCCLNIRQSRW